MTVLTVSRRKGIRYWSSRNTPTNDSPAPTGWKRNWRILARSIIPRQRATESAKRSLPISATTPYTEFLSATRKRQASGLNELVVANYVVHFDHSWNPAVMNQATARAHRPGQTKTVFAYDLWVEDTYEEIIFKLLERKQELYNAVIDSMSAERDAVSLAFAVADTFFAKYDLKPVQQKPSVNQRNQ